MKTIRKVVVIGGGTGTFVTLNGLKQYPVELTAIVTMMDSGGSTGKLRDQYGVLPPGDVRQALVALSDSDRIWRELFLYRFEGGDFMGHNFGNIFLTALEKITNNFEKSIALAETILKTKGHVVPVTLDKTDINAKLTDGSLLKTEALIDQEIARPAIANLFLDKRVKVNPKALTKIQQADVIIVGPGDLYTSTLPVFMFKKIKQIYAKSKAKKVLVLNLMNKLGHTDNFQAADFLREFSKYLGATPFNYLVINNQPIPKPILDHYRTSGESQVVNDLQTTAHLQILQGRLISNHVFAKNRADKLNRSLLRHDSQKLARFLWEEIISSS